MSHWGRFAPKDAASRAALLLLCRTRMELSSRRSPRVLVGVGAEVSVSYGKTVRRCDLLQISEGGLLLGLAPEPSMPDRVELTFRLPGGESHTVHADVRHRTPRGGFRLDAEAPTVGCSFLNIHTAARKAIATYVDKQKETLKQLQFSLALMPPSPRVREYATKVGLKRVLPVPEMQQFVTWSIAQLST